MRGATATVSSAEDSLSEASRQSIETGSKSFAAAVRLFDPVTRDSARMFYAWCRHCDDVIDGQVSGYGSIARAGSQAERLAALEAQTRAVLAGEPASHQAFAALGRIARQHALPHHLPLDILQGCRMDVEQRTYATLDDLLPYCYGVAGAVGVAMAVIMGVRPDETEMLDRACDLGLAFQLTNIARDVMEDARVGRVYLPAELFGAREAVGPAFILDPRNRTPVIEATRSLLEYSERYYASARVGIAGLPWRSAWAVATALGVYREIGKQVRAADDPWAERQSVPSWRKLWHVAAASTAPLRYRVLGERPRTGLWTRPPVGWARSGPNPSLNSSGTDRGNLPVAP